MSGDEQRRMAAARDGIAKKVMPAQVAEAQRRAREWTAASERRQS
jgi:hypothetical protein